MRAAILLFSGLIITTLPAERLCAQARNDTTHATRSDTTLPSSPLPSGMWRAPQSERNAGDLRISDEAIRYYASPTTLGQLMEAVGGPYPLLLGDEAYGRESYLMTPRTSEGLNAESIDGLLPATSILNGASLSNYYPLDGFSAIDINSMATGARLTGADVAASDVTTRSIERFRAPVPYSRIHYTQDLVRSLSDFDGLFSINLSQPVNVLFGIHRRSSGRTPNEFDQTFNARSDDWSVRGQMSVSKYLGTIPSDSTWTRHKTDSLLSTPDARKNTLDLLIWGQYTTAFSGLSGGIVALDSVDVFQEQVAPVYDRNTFDHRVRGDALAELEIPFLADARTRIAAFASEESRRILSRDSTFAPWVQDVAGGARFGATLEQPLALTIGAFQTRATLRGDAMLLQKDSSYTYSPSVRETRFAAMFSDSLALRTALRIALFGFARTLESNLTLSGGTVSSVVFPSAGLFASIGLTDALAISASYQYAKDRASLSPSPNQTYQIRNIGAWVDLRVPFGRSDSVAIHAGVLDRHEPEGVVYDLTDGLPKFSNVDLHTQSAQAAFDGYFGSFHFASSVSYFPSVTPISDYNTVSVLQSDLLSRWFGFAGLYYEHEIGEGNLRMRFGPRVRTLSRLGPQLSYDPASDYYIYRGLDPSFRDSTVFALADNRINTPKYIVDLLLSAEVDRRAQVNASFLNILSAPYYNVSLYPRPGFHFRIDVTWAFLD